MNIYVIDNYDSFVYNIIHILKELNIDEIKVVKNNAVDFEEINNYDAILLSPGPGIPKDAGKMMEVIDKFHKSHSIFGVCLGHQALGEYFGWDLKQLEEPLHGISSEITIQNHQNLFDNLPEKIEVGHYHSWVVNSKSDTEIEVLAQDKKGNVMALSHKNLPIFGVQFHPESVLTEKGKNIIENWLKHS